MEWRLDAGQIEVPDEAVMEMLRKKTPAERVEMISAAHRTARNLIAGGVRHQYPTWTDKAVEAEVSRRLLGLTEQECSALNLAVSADRSKTRNETQSEQ